MNKRVIYQGEKATIKYEGPLMHENKGDDIWIGVEWDNPARGKHNGNVGGYQYFQTSDGGNSGSMLRKEKVTLGNKMIDALFLKYFKEIPPELLQDENKQQENTINPESVVVTLMNQKQVVVEFDNTAFFETIKKKKKMVEFYGFDEIYKKITNLEKIQELSLESQAISTIGPYGFTAGVFKNLRNLSLEDNLLHSWHQVFCLGNQLKTLRELSISGNFIQLADEDTKIYDHEQNGVLDIPIEDSCNHIEVLVLINMRLKWKDITKVLPAFRGLQELLLCKNDLTDYENIKFTDKELQSLKLLNLESTNQSDFTAIQIAFGDLPKVEKLVLNKNNLTQLPQINKFKQVSHISLDHNLFIQPIFLSRLASMPLTILSIKHNPLQEKLGKLYVRQRAIAELSGLQILNGSQITKFERKDSEIFYLKSSFEEYFILKKVKHYYYDFDDLMVYVQEHHPKIPELIKKFGNPYEIDPTVKGEFNKPKQNTVQYIVIKLIDRIGKLKDKPTDKKFMTNTGIFSVKQVVSKLCNIPLKQVVLSIKVSEDQEEQPMEGKDMILNDFQAQDGSIIYVDQIKD